MTAAQGTEQDDRAALARLAHDVGKHLARTAHNAHGPFSPALHAMLVKDLYALAGMRASELFEQRVPGTTSPATRAVLERCREQLHEIDALEPEVRAAEPAAIARACALALAVEAALRELTSMAAGTPP